MINDNTTTGKPLQTEDSSEEQATEEEATNENNNSSEKKMFIFGELIQLVKQQKSFINVLSRT